MKWALNIFAVVFLACGSESVFAQAAKPDASLSIQPKQIKIKVGQEFSVKVEVQKVQDLFGAPFYLLYDPKLLDVLKVTQGDFLKKDGKKTAFLFRADKPKGKIIVGLTRLGPVGGMEGEGTLVVVVFKALQAGHANLTFDRVEFKDSHLTTIPLRIQTGSIDVAMAGGKGKDKKNPEIPGTGP
jgi:general secretion pathway protein D